MDEVSSDKTKVPYVLDFQNVLLFITGKLEILKEIATAKKKKKTLPKFHRTWVFLLSFNITIYKIECDINENSTSLVNKRTVIKSA